MNYIEYRKDTDGEKSSWRQFRVFMVYEPSYDFGLLCTLGSLLLYTSGNIIIDIVTRPAYAERLSAVIGNIPPELFKNKQLNIIQMPAAFLNECNSISYSYHFKPEICFRLFYFDLVEPQDNVIYLDIDTIVLVDLVHLLHKLSGLSLPIAARQSPIPDVSEFLPENVSVYFNSGVIFFNVDQFYPEIRQKMHESQRLMPQLAKQSIYLDQDILNIVFSSRWSVLDAKFNYKTSDAESVDISSDVILHAAGSRKPWFFGSHHRFSEQYTQVMTRIGIPTWKRYNFTWILPRIIRKIVK